MSATYNHSMGDKHKLHQRLIEQLRAQAGDVERMTRGLDEASVSQRPSEGSWSLKELVCHLWVVQKLFRQRAEKMLAEDNPTVEKYHPDDDTDFARLAARPMTDVLADFQAERDRYLGILEPLTPAQWHRGAVHPEYARYDIHFMTEYLYYHEAHHVYTLLQRRAAFGKIPH